MKHISVPTLLVQNSNDPWTNLEMVKAYYDGLTSRKRCSAGHRKNRFAAYDYLGKEPAEVLSWFDKKV